MLCRRIQSRVCRYFHSTSLEWYYKVLKNRFKQSTSVNVSTILSQHQQLHQQPPTKDLHQDPAPDSSSLCKPKRIQAGESTMGDWSKAMRMAGEVIQETLEKGDYDSESQEKKIELQFLKEHRLEVTEELATTIYQQIINEKHYSQEARVVVSGKRRLSMPSTAVEEIEYSSQGTCFLNSFLGYSCHVQDPVPSSFSHACSERRQDDPVQMSPRHATVGPDIVVEEEEEEEEEFYRRLDALTGEWSEENEDSDEERGQGLGQQASVQQKMVQLMDGTCNPDNVSNHMDHEKQTGLLLKETEKGHPGTATPSELGDENET
uniref:rab effector MyRIP-like isoform X2 n=1 Tax=Myxine glutinosa TaxID=7769 RepID=UPI00358EA25C